MIGLIQENLLLGPEESIQSETKFRIERQDKDVPYVLKILATLTSTPS